VNEEALAHGGAVAPKEKKVVSEDNNILYMVSSQQILKTRTLKI
jgi:hypothetical protein